jgi:phenylalanyl-tRNA synthetase beta chain
VLLSASTLDERLSIEIADERGCPRFAARVIENVGVGPSPEWLQQRLRAIGLRPINNVVDVSNYVAAELGQPLHAFDLERFRQESSPVPTPGQATQVLVRGAGAGERVATLDGEEHTLTAGDLVVCAGDRPVSIAGIIGGQSTAVDGATRTVLLEAAAWHGPSIRATSRRLGVRTDASSHFEKGLSDTLPPLALERAAALIAEIAGGHVLRGVADAHPAPLPAIPPIHVRSGYLDALLGMHVDPSEAATADSP